MKTDSDPHGWRIAALVVLLALTLVAGAHYIHTKVYCNPAHPSCIKSKAAPESHAAAAEHPTGAAAAEPAHPPDTAKKAADHGKSGF